jgi:hypothetical protein
LRQHGVGDPGADASAEPMVIRVFQRGCECRHHRLAADPPQLVHQITHRLFVRRQGKIREQDRDARFGQQTSVGRAASRGHASSIRPARPTSSPAA